MRKGRGDVHITHSNHANSLPNAQTHARNNATIQTPESVLRVDVLCSVSNRHLLRTVRILRLALHLHTDDLDRLVPSRETTTQTTGEDLLKGAQLGALLLASHLADTLLGQARETESGTPVGHLANGHSVDALVDALDTILAVDIHESRKRAGRLGSGGSELGFRNLYSFHAGTETHGRVGLGHTTRDTTRDTGGEVASTVSTGIVFGLGGDKEKDGALGGSFNPGPRDETLVDYFSLSVTVPL
jgi:hypothetical protein